MAQKPQDRVLLSCSIFLSVFKQVQRLALLSQFALFPRELISWPFFFHTYILLQGKFIDWPHLSSSDHRPILRSAFISSPLRPEQCVCLMSFPFGLPTFFSFFSVWGLPLGEAGQHAGETCVFTLNIATEKDSHMPIPGTVTQNT